MSGKTKRLVAALLVSAAAATTAGCGGGTTKHAGAAPATNSASAASPHTKKAPAFSAVRLGGTDTISLASLKGKTVLLSAWATWCTTCREELPAIQRLADQEGPKGLKVIGVDLDGSPGGALDFVHENKLTFDMVHDPDSDFQAAFKSVGVPTSILIDAQGNLVKMWQGRLDVDAALPLIHATMAKGA